MSLKRKALSVAAALTVIGGITSTGMVSASAATPQCGAKCIEVFSPRFGPGFIESVRHGVAEVGQPTLLGLASSSNPAGDLMAITFGAGLVSDFYAAGMVSAGVNLNFGNLHAVQLEYAPSGQPTGLCTGVAEAAFENEALSLQPCSTPGITVWIIDPTVAPVSEAGFFAIINGSTTDFSSPLAMTYRHKPPARIRLDHLELSDNGTVDVTQLWGRSFGVVS
jgi:hypothetical protein